MSNAWIVYVKNAEMYSMWINLLDVYKIKNVIFVSEKPNEEMWAKVKHSRKYDPIQGKVNS